MCVNVRRVGVVGDIQPERGREEGRDGDGEDEGGGGEAV